MSLSQDLAAIALQEERLQFERFDANIAWEIGSRLKAAAEAQGLAVAIDIALHGGATLFFFAMPGTGPDNIDWIRRKKNVVARYHRSSYAIGLDLRQKNTTLREQVGVDDRDFAPHGGCFPIKLRGTGCVGSITVSGLPQRKDHALVVEVLADYLKQSLAELALADPDPA